MRRLMVLLALAASPAVAQSAASPLTAAIAAYNDLPEHPRPVNAQSIPDWAHSLAFTPREALALVAAVGAFTGSDPSLPESRADHGALGVAAQVVGSVGFLAARTEAERANGGPVYAAPSDIQPRQRRLHDSRSDYFLHQLFALDSCAGALTSAARKLSAARPDDSFARQIRQIGIDQWGAAAPPDANCNGS